MIILAVCANSCWYWKPGSRLLYNLPYTCLVYCNQIVLILQSSVSILHSLFSSLHFPNSSLLTPNAPDYTWLCKQQSQVTVKLSLVGWLGGSPQWMVSNNVGCCPMVLDGVRWWNNVRCWCRMVSNNVRCCRMVSNGVGWWQMVSNNVGLCQMFVDGVWCCLVWIPTCG